MAKKKVEEAPVLTEADEKILDRVWKEVLDKEEEKERWGKNPPQRR